jgi:hypothetical protein
MLQQAPPEFALYTGPMVTGDPSIGELARMIARLEGMATTEFIRRDWIDVHKAEIATIRAEMAGLGVEVRANAHDIEEARRAGSATRNAVLVVGLGLLGNIVLMIVTRAVGS